MSPRPVRPSSSRLPWLAAWLMLGTLTLLCTPLDAWTPWFGWGPGLCLVVTPLGMLLVLEPRLPLVLLAAALRRRQRRRSAVSAGAFNPGARARGGAPCGAGIPA